MRRETAFTLRRTSTITVRNSVAGASLPNCCETTDVLIFARAGLASPRDAVDGGARERALTPLAKMRSRTSVKKF